MNTACQKNIPDIIWQEKAGHVSGVWIGLHGIDFDLAVLPSNRLSFHAALRRRIQVSHPNLFTFLEHLQHVTTESTHDMARLTNGLRIKRAKKKMNLINERRMKACMGRFDAGCYICLSIILQLQEVYTTYLAAVTCILPLFWKELHTAL